MIYFAIAYCGYGSGGCQEAKFFGRRARVRSPDFSTEHELNQWLTSARLDKTLRTCRHCKRVVSMSRFDRRRCEAEDRYSVSLGAVGGKSAVSDRTGLVVPSGILTTENFARFEGSGEGSRS